MRAVARRRFPSAYGWGTNLLRLTQWSLRGQPDAVYDDAFWDLHAGGDWNGLARAILDVFPRATSVVDVGCGQGLLLAALHATRPDLRLHGIDSSAAALARARRRGVNAECLDLSAHGAAARRALFDRVRGFDLGVCLETAEHLPPWCARTLVQGLAGVPAAIFSAAQLGQGGTMHLNERPLEYWQRLWGKAGYELHPSTPDLRSRLSQLDLPWWYAANVQVFARSR
jgi:SAM-dependent methyltransferase